MGQPVPAGHAQPRTNHAARTHYRGYLAERPDLVAAAVAELHGKDLVCWCAPELACRADVLLQIARVIPLDQVHFPAAA